MTASEGSDLVLPFAVPVVSLYLVSRATEAGRTLQWNGLDGGRDNVVAVVESTDPRVAVVDAHRAGYN